jgi:hypothetical protein
MLLILLLVVFASVSLLNPPASQAIVFLPAVILIPITKIVAVIMGGASLPSLLASLIWGKRQQRSWLLILGLTLLLVLIIGLVAAVVIWLLNPERPFF